MKTIQEDAMKTRVSMIIIAVCLAAMAGLSACKSSTPGAKKADALPDAIKISVSVAKAQRRTLIQERKILATLEAYRETDLGPLSPGRVKSLSVQIGDNVEAGQVVAKMDDAQLVATEAQFASLKSQYERSLSLYRNDALPKAQFGGAIHRVKAAARIPPGKYDAHGPLCGSGHGPGLRGGRALFPRYGRHEGAVQRADPDHAAQSPENGPGY